MTAEQRALFDIMPYLEQDEYFDIHGYKMQPEVCPGTFILAVNNRRQAEDVWWTIEDFDQRGVWRRVINAKAENVLAAGMFKNAFLHDRILVPATAVYEWQDQPDRTKKKFELWFDEPVFAMAGLARDCRVKDEEKRCGVIITTRANHVFAEIHNSSPRQPVIIHKSDFDRWLDPATSVDELKRMMEPVSDEETHYAPAADAAPSAQNSLFS